MDKLSGALVCPSALASLLLYELAQRDRRSGEPAAELTERERQIADLIAKGRSTAEIAAEFNIGDASVNAHIHNMLGKLSGGRRVLLRSRLHSK